MAKKQKVHSLTGRITIQLMYEAFKAVKRNRGAAGIDKVSIEMIAQNLDANLNALMKDLKTRGVFAPKPLRRVWIVKDPQQTKFRLLGIPAVRDRVAQEVVRRLLEPIFEPIFHDCFFRIPTQTQRSHCDSASAAISSGRILCHSRHRYRRFL